MFHDNKSATVNGWLLNHRLHAVWFLRASYPVSSWAGLSGLELPSIVHNLHIYISVLLLVRKQLKIDHILNFKDRNLKSILTTVSILLSLKSDWMLAVGHMCLHSLWLCSFMCLPLRLVLSGTPAAAAGSHSLGRRRSVQPWLQSDTLPSCSGWQSSGRPPPWWCCETHLQGCSKDKQLDV